MLHVYHAQLFCLVYVMSNFAYIEGGGTNTTISEVGYITNKLTEKLKARGAHDVLAPVHPHQKSQGELSSDDIWQHEKENWMRQKEELKAWAKSQGTDASNQSPKVGRFCDRWN